MQIRTLVFRCLVLLLCTPLLGAAQSGTITGAGSSAAKLVYETWGQRFAAETRIALDYRNNFV